MNMRAGRPFLLAMLVLTLTASQPAAGQLWWSYKTGTAKSKQQVGLCSSPHYVCSGRDSDARRTELLKTVSYLNSGSFQGSLFLKSF